MLIIFEGVDHCGKSTLSVLFQEAVNTDKRFRDAQGDLIINPHMGNFIWTKQPMFTTEEADLLNSQEYKNEFKRERLFFESRLKHREVLASSNVICDRYTWTGISYAKVFSPKCYDFIKECYMNSTLFLQPDLHILVDTPVEVCHERNPSESLDNYINKRNAYYDTMKYIKTPIIVMESVGPLAEVLEELLTRFKNMLDGIRGPGHLLI